LMENSTLTCYTARLIWAVIDIISTRWYLNRDLCIEKGRRHLVVSIDPNKQLATNYINIASHEESI